MATVAKTKQDVDNMTKSERLWDSLSDAYGKQMEASDKSYDTAISQADRRLLSRGMQRSSYGGNVLGNLSDQKNRARNDINSALIADYENRLANLEQQDAEAERWEKQFAEGVRQFNENLAYQREENAAARDYNTAERIAQQIYNTSERVAQQQHNTAEAAANRAWQAEQAANQMAWQSGENALNRDYQTKEREAQQEYQSGENALNRAENARQFNEQMGYNREQAAIAAEQFNRQFDQGNADTDRKLAASYVAAIVEQGGTPSDELLARAGLSRADAEAMRKGAKASGGSGGNGGDGGDDDDKPTGNPDNLFDDETLDTSGIDWSNIAALVKGGMNIKGIAGVTAGPYIPASSTSNSYNANVQSPNAYKDAFEGEINDAPAVNPISEALFSADEYVEYDMDENKKDRKINTNNRTKGKSQTRRIKSTITPNN